MKTNYGKILRNGILDENPIFRLVLGMCATLAITTSVFNGFGMGMAATFVLVGSNVVISLLRNFIPDKVRIPCYIVVIATFTTIVQLLMEAFLPELNASLGLFIPLIVVNCIILARAESFASKNGLLASAMDGLGMGLGFTLALLVLSVIRELLGSGTLLGVPVLGAGYTPAAIMTAVPGGFLTLGLLMTLINKLTDKDKK